MVNPTQVPVSGPLAEFGPGFASELLRQGYKTNPAGVQMNLMAHLSRWLADEGLDVHGLSDTEVERYLRARRGAGLVIHCGSRAMRPILAYLRGLGVAPTPSITLPDGPVEVVLEHYRQYLTVDRGLTTATARGYIYAVRPFLCGRILPDGHALNLEHLRTLDITAFIVACCANGSRGTAKQTVTALRSLLRFLHVEGMVKQSLVAAVPSIARWHLARLPKSLEPAQVSSLLAACDRRTKSGRRDFAILTLLVRLGLRAGEVAALTFDDIDWRAGEMVIHGKGKRADRLPLPTDVGEAIAAYLRRGRRANAEVRSVFVRLNAPHHALSTSGVSNEFPAPSPGRLPERASGLRGYKLERDGKLLAQFLTYLEDHGQQRLSTEAALAWAMLPTGAHQSWWSCRLSIIRGFAAHLKTIDPETEVPPTDLLPRRSCRATPYLYSEEEVAALFAVTATLRTAHRVATYRTLIGLLAVTGMRVGEAIALDRGDFDSINGLLIVRKGKFGKSRQLPLHPTVVDTLRRYLCRHDRPRSAVSVPALFVSGVGARLLYSSIQQTFRQLVGRAGLKPRSASCRPRLHDLRHSFAIFTLLDCYRNGSDTAARLPLLSTYLGHVDPAKTYWYLSATPELLALAGSRLERHLGDSS